MFRSAHAAWVLLLGLALNTAEAAVIREDIGELKIHDLLLRPYTMLKEPKQGSFSIGESSFALRWELEQQFSGVIRIGPRTLLNPLARYQAAVDDDVILVEAFAQYDNPYGRFRMGRIPMEFGYEGALWERALIFPRSLLFQRRTMMLRDVGFAYDIEHNNWFTGVTIHNGESDTDLDGRTWYTARWGYRSEKFEIGLAGQTGSTKPIATTASTDKLAGVDPNKEAKWRLGGIYVHVEKKKLEYSLEYYMGEREQEEDIGKFNTGHVDVGYQFSKWFGGHLRYDHYDPNQALPDDLERVISAAIVLSNKTRSSNLILVGSKVLEESTNISNDELRLIWSLSPSGVVRF